eukprot:TRINITY_DN8210_c0_g2_i2.p1 TRINITY_DN8210_c0_g2~~TRINITY_DN8210_c0_g2_i2.p1  ORF type:complete len:325 (+),score=107.43 TRINITY_DN8210_c0_g2_i2:38-976(+)
MDGWGYGKALLGAVTDGVRDLVKPDFEDGDYDEKHSEEGSEEEAEKDTMVTVNRRQYELLKEEVRRSRKVKQEAEERVVQYAKQSEEAGPKIASLEEQLTLLQEKSATQEQAFRTELSIAQASHSNEVSALSATIHELQGKIKSLEAVETQKVPAADTAKLEATIAQLQKELQAVPDLKAEIAVLKTADEDHARLKEEAKEAHKLRLKVTSLQACESEAELLKDELKDLKSELEELQRANEELAKERDGLKSAVASKGRADANHEETRCEIENLENELREAKERNQALQQEVVDSRTEGSKVEAELGTLVGS